MEWHEDPRRVPIEDLNLTIRAYNCLMREGIDTVGQLAMLPEGHLIGLRNFPPEGVDSLKRKLDELGLSPWDVPQSAQNRAEGGTAGQIPGPRKPAGLSRRALSVAGARLPAAERGRWVEEWKGELYALGSRKARAMFVMSLLFAGGRRLAVTLRHLWPGEKPA